MKILLFHAGALGDLVNTLPAISALSEKLPDAAITAVGNPAWLTLLKSAGMVEEAVSLERPGFHMLFAEGGLAPEVEDFLAGYDLAFSWIRSPQLSGHLISRGIQTMTLKGDFPPLPGSAHVTEIMAGPMRDFGISEFPEYPILPRPVEAPRSGPEFRGLLFHPGSGSDRKNWPAERFAQAARLLKQKTGLEIGLLEGPADHDAAKRLGDLLADDVKVRFKNLSVIELAHLLAGPALMLGNDSGVSHLAGALGTPVVAVFGPTDPRVWGVKQINSANLAPKSACAPCSPEIMRACKDKECLESVAVEKVLEAGLELLSKKAGAA